MFTKSRFQNLAVGADLRVRPGSTHGSAPTRHMVGLYKAGFECNLELADGHRVVETCADLIEELTGVEVLGTKREATANDAVHVQLNPVLRP